MQKVIVIVGPTASGKSALAVELAKRFDGEVISADSRQVYRGLDIGTGKITQEETQGVPHHLLDVADPTETFSASDFVKLGREAITDIASRGKLPIICGGTGFYIDALLGRITLPDVPANPTLREELKRFGADELFAKLQALDPARAETVDPHNPVRLIRAIEIATALGAVPQPKAAPLYDAFWIGIEWPKEELDERIRQRLVSRMKDGMVDEAKRLHAAGLSYERMHELGLEYRYLADYLQGTLTNDEFIEQLATAIIQYAKRQRTYWKPNVGIHWAAPSKITEIAAEAERFLR